MSRARITVFVLTATGLAAIGCGGSKAAQTTKTQSTQQSASATSPSGQVSQSELVAKANAVCARLRAEGTATVIRSRQEYSTKLPLVAQHYQTAAAELAALTPPASMKQDWQQLITAHRRIAADTLKILPYIEAQNRAKTRRLYSDEQGLNRNIVTIAARDGYTECGRPLE